MTVKVTFTADIHPKDINPSLYPYMEWSSVSIHEMLHMSNEQIMHAPTNKIISVLKTQELSGVNDEFIMSVIVKHLKEIDTKASPYASETRLVNFVNAFVSAECLKRNVRQILALIRMCNKEEAPPRRLFTLLVLRELVPRDVIYNVPYHSLPYDVLCSKFVSTEMRKKIIQKTNYFDYMLENNLELEDMPIILKSTDLTEMGIPVPFEINSSTAMNFINASSTFIQYRDSNEYLDWDTLVDMYYSGDILCDHMNIIWENFIHSYGSSFPVLYNDGKNTYQFEEEDFK